MFEPPEFSNRHRLESAMAGWGCLNRGTPEGSLQGPPTHSRRRTGGPTGDVERRPAGRSGGTSRRRIRVGSSRLASAGGDGKGAAIRWALFTAWVTRLSRRGQAAQLPRRDARSRRGEAEWGQPRDMVVISLSQSGGFQQWWTNHDRLGTRPWRPSESMKRFSIDVLHLRIKAACAARHNAPVGCKRPSGERCPIANH